MFVGTVAILPLIALLPEGIHIGNWQMGAFVMQDPVISPPPPPFGLYWSPLRQKPPVWDPKGPEIQVGPELPWSEGGNCQIVILGWMYTFRAELPSGRYQIAPPLP